MAGTVNQVELLLRGMIRLVESLVLLIVGLGLGYLAVWAPPGLLWPVLIGTLALTVGGKLMFEGMFGALGVVAASQGTMNNLTFGNAEHQYYETIGGGSGAGPDFDGVAAIQSHMTNSRLTDPEILEARYPVIVEEFSIRQGSGGKGAHHGGDGVKRRIRFREDMQVGILSTRRDTDPFGLSGGKDGARGINTLIRADGERIKMQGRDEAAVKAGDAIEIETPGGGGFGTS